MKNLWLHGIYLTVISILGFQLWSKMTTVNVNTKQIEETLEKNCQMLFNDSQMLFFLIERNKETNPPIYQADFLQANRVMESVKTASNFIDLVLTGNSTNKISNIKSIKDSLNTLSKILTEIEDKIDNEALKKQCLTLKTLQNDTFWNNFEENESTNLLILKNQFKIDELNYLNYFLDKGGSEIDIQNTMGIKILPTKSVLIEGEKFEANFFLARYALIYSNQNLTYTVDNQNLPFKEGLAYFSRIENTTGLKSFKVKALIRNPKTGEKLTLNNEFQYHVLPKCSQNCQ